MIADCVLDTSAMVAFLRLEPGAEQVRQRLHTSRCVMHAVNVAELCFTAPRRMPEHFTPESTMALLNAMDFVVSTVLDPNFLQMTAKIRLAEQSLSIGDGMADRLGVGLEAAGVDDGSQLQKSSRICRDRIDPVSSPGMRCPSGVPLYCASLGSPQK